MDLLTRDELEAIANPDTAGPHVSMFMPTQRVGSESEADRLRWKNLVSGVETALADQMRRPDIEELLAPAHRLHDDALEWQDMSDGLVMYLSPAGHRTYRVPAPMVTLATVGDRPVLGPLVRLLSGDEHFFALAISQQEMRLLEGSRNTVEQVELAQIPTSLEDVVGPPDGRATAMATPMGSRGGRAVFFGHAGEDSKLKHDDMTRFLREVAHGLKEIMRGQLSPMVLVGLEQNVVAYREHDEYGHTIEAHVEHNPDDLSLQELHDKAWPLIEARLQERRAHTFERFSDQRGTGLVSSDLDTVEQAANEGRIETLFVRADPWCWEQATDEAFPVVRLGADERFAECERVDAAVVATLNHAGQVFGTAQTAVDGSEVAAIFRY